MASKRSIIAYFGYGPCVDPDVIKAITGKDDIGGYPATLEGYKLVVQRLSDLPREVKKDQKTSAKEKIRVNWGDKFEMYAIVKGEGRVRGMVWLLSKEDMDLMKDWELIELGWYTIVKADVVREGDKMVIKDVKTIAIKNQTFDKSRNPDGEDYDPWLDGRINKEVMVAIATQSRKEYLEKLGEHQPLTGKSASKSRDANG